MKKNYVLLRKEIETDPLILADLLDKGTLVVCRNGANQRVKKLNLQALFDNDEEFWKKSGKPWSFYISTEDLREVQEIREYREKKQERSLPREESVLAAVPLSDEERTLTETPEDSGASDSFGLRFGSIQGLSLQEREELLDKDKMKLQELSSRKKVSAEEKLQTLVDVTADSALVNKVSVDEAFSLENADAQLLTTKLLMQTDDIIDAVTGILSKDFISNKLFTTIMDKSDGSTVRHMTRVFLKSLSFLIYYNEQVNKYSLAHKVRSRFDEQYRRYYMRLLPGRHATEVTLNTAFEGGLKTIPSEDLHQMATGFLLHDVGKQVDIEYYEGDESYHRETVVRHASVGEAMLKDKTSYSDDAAAVAGYHHEYYNDPQGYGTYRPRLALVIKHRPSHKIDHAVSFSLKAVQECRALGFFPAKILEIVDVYDALTDPDRKYKEPVSPEEALKIIRTDFVQRHIKLDPILFDIFVNYLKASGEIDE